MRKFLAIALTGVCLAFATLSGGAQAAPAAAAADLLRNVKESTVGQTQEVRHRRWHRRHWHHRKCRKTWRCYRTRYGKLRCGYVRRCW